MADTLASELLDNIDAYLSDARIRNALAVVLMFLSDCFRYSHDDQKSRDAARLLQIISPKDPEAHMRLGMTLATLNSSDEPLEPFFHYCVFLANRKVPVDHEEAVVVSKFVESLANVKKRDHATPPTARTVFFRTFINMLWSILAEDLDTSTKKAKEEQLWDSFKQLLDDDIVEADVLHTVGILIFVHHRIIPRGNSDYLPPPQRELCDFVVGKIIRMISRSLLHTFQEMNAALRARKKNRRRAMQKKRKHDGACNPENSTLAIGFDTLNTVVDLRKAAPSLGGLSLLAQYWSKARSAPSATADISPLARTFHALQSLLIEVERVEELTCTKPTVSFILDRIVSDTNDRTPAMPEDVKLSYLLPCIEYGMFDEIALPEVPLPSVFKKTDDGIFKYALKNLGGHSYESLVMTSAQRHLEAFSTLIAKEVNENNCKLEKKAACTLVELTVRKHRITRLVTDLAKVGGGRVARMSLQLESDSNVEVVKDNRTQYDGLPPPAQPREDEPEKEDSLHEQITESQLAFQVRKRRRVLGNCTAYIAEYPAAGSPANLSNEGRRWSDEQQSRQDNICVNAISPVLPKCGNVRTTEYTDEHTLSRMPSQRAILSQGSLQLDFAQPPEAPKDTLKSQDARNSSMRLYTLLRNLLYPPEGEVFSTPSDTGPIYWRSAPKGDFAQDVFSS